MDVQFLILESKQINGLHVSAKKALYRLRGHTQFELVLNLG